MSKAGLRHRVLLRHGLGREVGRLNPGGFKRHYLRRWIPGRGLVYEHRYVMEQHLGRRLLRSEQVHHINGDTFDNRLENLELHSGQSDHFVHHQKVPHATLVALYCTGLSCEAVAKRVGISPRTVHTAVKKAGVSRTLQEAVALRDRNRHGQFRAQEVEGS